MGKNPLKNYLSTFRKRSSLSQDDTAWLLGCKSGRKISLYERFLRQPELDTALAFVVLYGKPIERLFAGDCQKLRQEIVERAKELKQKIQQLPETRDRRRKLAFLEQFADAESDPRP